jgi:AcrR family transcriptional regulator
MAPQTARVLALAFDPEIQPAGDATSQRALDAALDLAAASGLKNLTMDDVARRAGVGRMTVYRRFGDKATLLDALAVRECRRCLAEIGAALNQDDPVDERVASLAVATLRVIRRHPLLERLGRVEPEALLNELTRDGSAVFCLVREFLIALTLQAQRRGEMVAGDPALLAEFALRLGASFVLMPDSVLPLENEAALHEALRALYGPLVQAG